VREKLQKFIDGGRLWVLLYALLISSGIFIAFSNWAYDDPYISYRYATNLAQGQGFVYNLGVRSLSTTSPFFVILLAVLYPIWSDPPHLANLLGALSLALGGVLLWDLARTWKSPLVGYTSLILYPTFPLVVSTLGSETPLYITFSLASFVFYVRQKGYLTALFTALTVLTRPDGVIIPILLIADYLLRLRRPFPKGAVSLFLIITLPWFIFAWLYFGSPLPLTLAAKQQQGLMETSQRFGQGFLSLLQWYVRYSHLNIEAILSFIGVVFLAILSRQWALFVAWPVLYFIAYSLLGVSGYFWYYAPLVPGFLVLVGLGLSGIKALVLFIKKHRKPHPDWINWIPTSLIILLIAWLTLSQASNLQLLRERPDARYRIYRVAGEWLRMNTPINATIGTLEVGIIGYFSNRSMIDFAGLIQSDIAANLTQTTNFSEAAEWAVEHYQPDYLVVFEETLPNLENGYISQECQLVEKFQGADYGHEGILNIYACE